MKKSIKDFIRGIPFSALPIAIYKKYAGFRAARQERAMVRDLSRLSVDQKKIFYCGVPRHTNLGDLAQACCIRSWLKENYPEYAVVEIFDKVIVNPRNHFPDILRKIMGKDDYIFFQSGYNTHDIGGCQDEMHRVICDNFPDARIVFMPQTVLFLHAENQERTARSYNRCRRALFLGRDSQSAETAEKMFPDLPVYPYPDIVTTLIGKYHWDLPRDGVFFCVRNDLEKFYSDAELQECARRISRENDGISVVFGDTTVDESYAELVRDLRSSIEKIIRMIAGYRVVITDRYHGTIFSIVANTPVIVIKSNDHKVTTGVDWFKGVYDDRVYLAEDLSQAAVLAEKILHRPPLPPPEPYFQKHYYDKLKELIDRTVGRGE